MEPSNALIDLLIDPIEKVYLSLWSLVDLICRWKLGLLVVASLALFSLVIFLYHALKREHLLARTDSLTGILNRLGFEEAIKKHSMHGVPFTIVYIDLDRFKEVNDRFGHAAGDQALKLVARTLRHSLRATDILARLGGDEFTILLPETDAQGSRHLLEVVFQKLDRRLMQTPWSLGTSAGVVSFLTPPPAARIALKKADRIMYEIKKNRRKTLEEKQVLESKVCVNSGLTLT